MNRTDAGYPGTEKRKHPRTAYPPARRPVFRCGGQRFEVKDLSRGGLKFGGKSPIRAKGWIKGTVAFPGGPCIEVEGIVVRTEERAMGLSFIGELEDHVYRRIEAGGA